MDQNNIQPRKSLEEIFNSPNEIQPYTNNQPNNSNYSEIISIGVFIIIILFFGYIIYKLGRLTPKIYRKFERWLDK